MRALCPMPFALKSIYPNCFQFEMCFAGHKFPEVVGFYNSNDKFHNLWTYVCISFLICEYKFLINVNFFGTVRCN